VTKDQPWEKTREDTYCQDMWTTSRTRDDPSPTPLRVQLHIHAHTPTEYPCDSSESFLSACSKEIDRLHQLLLVCPFSAVIAQKRFAQLNRSQLRSTNFMRKNARTEQRPACESAEAAQQPARDSEKQTCQWRSRILLNVPTASHARE